MKLLVYPPLPYRKAERDDLLARLAWYLSPLFDSRLGIQSPKIRLISIRNLPKTLELADHFDPVIQDIYKEFRNNVQVVKSLTTNRRWIKTGGVTCLCFDQARIDEVKNLPFESILKIDPQNERYESSRYLRLASRDGLIPAPLVKVYRERFDQVKTLCGGKTVGIFGTGPSLDTVSTEQFDACFNIATNSMVVNTPLMDALKPRVIVASDPIFHAGCSSYAGEFREKLVEMVKRHDAYFIFPARDFHIYEYYLSEIRDKLIGVPMLAGHALASSRYLEGGNRLGRFETAQYRLFINDRMDESFGSVVTNNVMTFFLLPIAATLSRNAIAAGFDGRDPDADEYFWDHSKTSQIDNKMDAIKDCHPGFFSVDYNDYLREHVLTLERQLTQLRARGFGLHMVTPSHLPPLKPYYKPDIDLDKIRETSVRDCASSDKTSSCVTVIMPNFNAGNFIASAITSVIVQSYPNWELLIVDNGSTDISLDWIESFTACNDRIHHIYNPVKGVSASRNLGIDLAKGDYICFIDSDDELWARSLENRAKTLDEGEKALVFGRTLLVNANSQSLEVVTGSTKDMSAKDFETTCPIHTGSLMGRSEVIKSVSFPENMENGEDYLFFANLARMGYRYASLGDVNVNVYRIHSASVTQTDFAIHNRKLRSVYDFLKKDLSDHPFYVKAKADLPTEKIFVEQTAQRDLFSLAFLFARGERKPLRACIDMIESAIDPSSEGYIQGYAEADIANTPLSRISLNVMRALCLPLSSKQLEREFAENSLSRIKDIAKWRHEEDVRRIYFERITSLMRRFKAHHLVNEWDRRYKLIVNDLGDFWVPPTSQQSQSDVEIDFLSQGETGRWILTPEAANIEDGALILSREGKDFDYYAKVMLPETDQDIKIKVTLDDVSNVAYVSLGNARIATLKEAGTTEFVVTQRDPRIMGFTVAESYKATARITSVEARFGGRN